MGTELCCASTCEGKKLLSWSVGIPSKGCRMDSSMENRHWIGGKYSGQLSAASEAVTTGQRTMRWCRLSRLSSKDEKNVLPKFSAQFHPPLYQFGSFWDVQKKGHPSRTTGWFHSATLIVKRSVTLQIYPFLCFQ